MSHTKIMIQLECESEWCIIMYLWLHKRESTPEPDCMPSFEAGLFSSYPARSLIGLIHPGLKA